MFHCRSLQISLAENTAAKEYMHAHSGAENKSVLPQIFLDGAFKGVRTHGADTYEGRVGCWTSRGCGLLGRRVSEAERSRLSASVRCEWSGAE